jgi:serine/threonine protein kinase
MPTAFVTVKLLRDTAPAFVRSKELEHHMAVLGRLSHPSMVPLKSYYYARDEKLLLVYEFMPKGSLFSLLHGKLVLLSLCSEPLKNLA